jgi:gamma-glutamylcyclotransferase (GGCT)/AIG2-like uncharacterized protein YtfP
MKRYYLAYGSNLNIEEMKYRCPFAKPVGTSYIKDYRLIFKGTNKVSYLTIEPCEGSIVPVGVYEITPMDEANLDFYEGTPTLYSKHNIKVPLYDEEIEAIVYIMNLSFTYNIPSNSYLARCIQGYRNFSFNQEILNNALKNTIDNIAKKLVKEII